MSDHGSHHGAGGYEKRDISISYTLIGTILAVIFVVGSIILLNEYFHYIREQVIYEQQLQPQSKMLKELRAYEDSVMNSYGYADTTKQVYRIPIDKAMEMMVKDAESGK